MKKYIFLKEETEKHEAINDDLKEIIEIHNLVDNFALKYDIKILEEPYIKNFIRLYDKFFYLITHNLDKIIKELKINQNKKSGITEFKSIKNFFSDRVNKAEASLNSFKKNPDMIAAQGYSYLHDIIKVLKNYDF